MDAKEDVNVDSAIPEKRCLQVNLGFATGRNCSFDN